MRRVRRHADHEAAHDASPLMGSSAQHLARSASAGPGWRPKECASQASSGRHKHAWRMRHECTPGMCVRAVKLGTEAPCWPCVCSTSLDVVPSL